MQRAITYWCILVISIVIIHKKEPFSSFGLFKRFHRISFSAVERNIKNWFTYRFFGIFRNKYFFSCHAVYGARIIPLQSLLTKQLLILPHFSI